MGNNLNYLAQLRLIWLFLCLTVGGVCISAAPLLAEDGLSWKEINIVGDGTSGPYSLGDFVIIRGTVKVWIDSTWVSKQSYKIDWRKNQIRFSQPLPQGKVVRVRFQQFVPPLQKVYRHRELVLAGNPSMNLKQRPSTRAFKKPTSKTPDMDQWEALRVNGIKSLAVTVGSNQDLSLEQTLRLNISGRIGKDTEVLALLTDQNSPLQPEGNTEKLQDLDRVLFQVKRDNLAFMLGDYDLSFTQTELGRYERKLQGVCARFSSSRFKITAAGALSRGQFTTNEFMGLEGKQGPYQLKAPDGNTDIVVVAGSEKVWLNGELLKRGENNDYIIDYSSAQLTFTPHCLITSDSRITVDFEYSRQNYKRNSWALRSEVNLWDDKAHIGLTTLREGDDRNNPLAFSLSPSEKSLLRTAGDNPALAWVSGVDSSSAGKGHYRALNDTLPDGEIYRYYQFDPEGKSKYNLSFSWVGRGGDYEYVGGGVYKYVGKGKGEYLPRRFLPLPTAHQIEALDLALKPFDIFTLSGEVGKSDFDLNTFSPHNDRDNSGMAYKWAALFHLPQISFKNRSLGSLKLAFRYKSLGRRFRPLGRISEVEEKYRWGISSLDTTADLIFEQGEKREGISGSYHLTAHSALDFGYGELRKGAELWSRRRQLNLHLRERNLPQVNYRWTLLSPQRRGDILRQQGKVSWNLWNFVPQLLYESEFHSSGNRGEDFEQIGGGVSLSAWGPLSWSSKYERRWGWLSGKKNLAFTQQHRLQIKQWHYLTINAEHSRRKKFFPKEPSLNTKTDLADVELIFSPPNRAISGEIHYQLTSKEENKKLRNYLYVGKGKGTYIWEDTNGNHLKEKDEFIPDPFGDYILYVENVGEFQPVTELDSGLRLTTTLWKILPKDGKHLWSKILREFSSYTSYQVQKKNGRNGAKEITVRDRSFFQQDINLFERSRRASLYFKHTESQDLSNEYYGGSIRYYSKGNSFRLRLRSVPRSNVEFRYAMTKTTQRGRGASVDYQIDSHKFSGEFSHCPIASMELSLQAQLGKDREKQRSARANWVSLVPGISYGFKGKGKFRAQLDYTNVRSNKTTLVYQMAEGKRKGNNLRWNVGFDYRLGPHTSFSFTYYGRKEPRRETIQSLRAEARAYF